LPHHRKLYSSFENDRGESALLTNAHFIILLHLQREGGIDG